MIEFARNKFSIFTLLKKIAFYILLLLPIYSLAQNVHELINKGWTELSKDNDTTALKLFGEAYDLANKNNDAVGRADALLKLGIASYGSSISNGMKYATQSLNVFDELENKNPTIAKLGRSKCLILIATIKAREEKFSEAVSITKEALATCILLNDTSSSIGLANNLLGSVYSKLNKIDSSDYYFYEALKSRVAHNETTYLPIAYVKVGEIELRKGNLDLSLTYLNKALAISDSTQNRQGKISVLIALSNFYFSERNYIKTESILLNAQKIALSISDKSYYIKVLTQLKNLKKHQGFFADALLLEEKIVDLKESVSNSEKDHLTKSLEVQFGLSEKERELNLIKKEKDITKLTNYLLFGIIGFGSIIAIGFIVFLKRINKRDKQILEAKAALMKILEEQKILKEKQLCNEIEFKESQLSAMTLQMIQKNELMQELKEKLETISNNKMDSSVSKIINKGLNQDKEWTDFNTHFESINKNFYARIKQAFPGISPNEMKICALIKMNLSSKEMASILNISPDSVKTARYRLRKKLNLNTEDNLTDFILNLK